MAFPSLSCLPVVDRRTHGERPRSDRSVPVRRRQRENEEHSVIFMVGAGLLTPTPASVAGLLTLCVKARHRVAHPDRPREGGKDTHCVTGVHMASTGSARGGGRISILYSFPHALGAPGIGWTAWNQVNELVRAGHDVHLVAASIARPVAGVASRDHLALRRRADGCRTGSWDATGRSHGTTGSQPVPSPADRPRSCTCGRSPRRARSRRPRRRGIPAFREVPNTHTANAYEVVARESARLGLTPRAGASHTADPATARHGGAGVGHGHGAAGSVGCGGGDVPRARVRRGAAPPPSVRMHAGRTGRAARATTGPDSTAVFLGRVEPRKGLHHALDAWIASTASDDGRLLVFGAVDDDYRALLADRLDAPERRAPRRDPVADRRAGTGRRAPAAEPRGGQRARDLRGAGGRMRPARVDRGRARCSTTTCTASCTSRATSRP